MNEKQQIILEYCKEIARPVTAKQILSARFPEKTQPYINNDILSLIKQRKLIRNDNERPYTVRLPMTGEEVYSPKDYSRKKTISQKLETKSYLPSEWEKSFNEFWSCFFQNNRDYSNEMTLEQLIELKMVVGNIHNLITHKCTLMAADKICDILELPESDRLKMKKMIHSTNVHTNGYDIEYSGQQKVVCEVKGNVPARGKSRFGAQQKQEIIKDLTGLVEGKRKSSLSEEDLRNYYKFMCIISVGEHSVGAIRNLVNKVNCINGVSIEMWCGEENLRLDRVYVFTVTHMEF